MLTPATGRKLSGFKPDDFGFARRVEASQEDLLLAGGGGSPERIRNEIRILEARLRRLPFSDDGRSELQLRIGRLSGNAGVLKVGALTQPERDFLHQKAEQGVKVLQASIEEGILPGACTAYLHCIPALDQLKKEKKDEESMGVQVMLEALKAPARRILLNAGVPAPEVMIADLMNAEPWTVFDVRRSEWGQAQAVGLVDAARVVRIALETAVSGAMMALSTDTLVLKKKPKVSYEP
jgi:chaperonin GroEL